MCLVKIVFLNFSRSESLSSSSTGASVTGASVTGASVTGASVTTGVVSDKGSTLVLNCPK